jgi:hypothetical protein
MTDNDTNWHIFFEYFLIYYNQAVKDYSTWPVHALALS